MSSRYFHLRKLFFFAALGIDIIIFLMIYQNNAYCELRLIFLYPLFLLLIFRPFDLFKETVAVENDHLILSFRKHRLKSIPLSEITGIEGRSVLGLIPVLRITASGSHLDIPMKVPGAFDLEKHLVEQSSNKWVLGSFFNYYSALATENKSSTSVLIFWMNFYFLFAVVTPFFIWEKSLGFTLFWMMLSLIPPLVLAALLPLLNRIILSCSIDWGTRYIPILRHWIVFISAAIYLLQGIRISA